MAKVEDQLTLTLSGRWETRSAVLGSLREIVRFELADYYWDRYSESVRALDRQAVVDAAEQLVRRQEVNWVVVGDRRKIGSDICELEASLGEARWSGEVRYLDADGDPVE